MPSSLFFRSSFVTSPIPALSLKEFNACKIRRNLESTLTQSNLGAKLIKTLITHHLNSRIILLSNYLHLQHFVVGPNLVVRGGT